MSSGGIFGTPEFEMVEKDDTITMRVTQMARASVAAQDEWFRQLLRRAFYAGADFGNSMHPLEPTDDEFELWLVEFIEKSKAVESGE